MMVINKYLIRVLVVLIIIAVYILAPKPQRTLIGFYQSDGNINGYHVQLSIWRNDEGYSLFIDNREVSKGVIEKRENNTYELIGEEHSFLIDLEHDNFFEIVISKLNDGKPIRMINISYTPTGFSTEFTDVEEYKDLIN